MSILVLGKNGQVGQAVTNALQGENAIFWTRGDMDLCHSHRFESKIKCISPRVIINAAGYTAVDQAEGEQDLADQINHRAVAELARLAKKMQVRLIHFSTDYVFDGRKSGPYSEQDLTNPLNVYGATKLNGEKAIQESGCRFNIFRTSWVISSKGQNFVKKVLEKAAMLNGFSVVEDQFGAPTSAQFIAQIVAEVVRTDLEDGIYHLTSKGHTSWHGLATRALQLASDSGVKLKTSKTAVIAAKTCDFPQRARRPQNSKLSCKKLFSHLKIDQTTWEEQVNQVVSSVVRNA